MLFSQQSELALPIFALLVFHVFLAAALIMLLIFVWFCIFSVFRLFSSADAVCFVRHKSISQENASHK